MDPIRHDASADTSFSFTPNGARELPIGAHGIIGDGRTSALVGVDGSIDWLCWPRFDSPSVFGAILDPETGGKIAITPVSKTFTSTQRYDSHTFILETTFRVPGEGVVRIVDFMPWGAALVAEQRELHRRIECVEGEVNLEVVVDPRFRYGAQEARFEATEHGRLVRGGEGDRLAISAGALAFAPLSTGGQRGLLRLKGGECRWVVLSWGATAAQPTVAHRSDEKLRQTREAWLAWSRGITYQGLGREQVLRSALLLKLLIYAPTGAMVAAPTTSLPEWVGGVRNWDYRYTWTRDTAMAIRAANRVGCRREARDFLRFAHGTLEDERSLEIMYAIDGAEVPEERTLAHLRGHRGSGPVRIGNGAKDQLQLDTAGALLDCASFYESDGGTLDTDEYQRLGAVLREVEARWTEPDHGIWEPRGGKHHNVHSKVMCWLALGRGAELAGRRGDRGRDAALRAEASRIREDILARGLDSRGRHLVTAYGVEEPDAALLLAQNHGLLEPGDPRAGATIDWLRAELGAGDFMYRYHMDDGVGGAEGAFVLCGFWLAEALARGGRGAEAERVFWAHAGGASNHLGLLAEEVDPRDGSCLGNFPQAFSHLGLINAALAIGGGTGP